ncbi:MAG: tetratricopeptide repeat protein [Candidatus Rhabdochlamydia sp.]
MSISNISSQRFLTKLDESNTNKNDSAPVALTIKAKYDVNNIFSSAPAQSWLLQIAKTHKVAIKTIEDARQLGQAIRNAHLELGKKVSFLVVMAHGYSDQLQFGNEISWYQFWRKPFYQKNCIVEEDFSLLTPDAKIFLYSCNSGLGIAQSISNVSKKTVYAPIGDLWDTKTCLQNCENQEIKPVSYNEKNEQHVWEFTPYKASIPICSTEIPSVENQESFSQLTDYLKEAASQGDANAQWKLGMLFLLGIGTCQQSEKNAAYWIGLAAEKGMPQAQFELGTMHLSGRGDLQKSDEEAGKWFSLSADKGYPQALFQMGIIYLNGQCGFKQSDELAAQFFTLAAAKGIPQALFNLGVLYEYGRGVPLSLSYAKHIYEIADGLGISEAKVRLDNLLQLGNQGLNFYETFVKGVHFLAALIFSWVYPPHLNTKI